MRRIIKIFCIGIVFLTFGCSSKEKYDICTVDIKNSSENYTLTATYKIYHGRTFVTKIEKEESYKSDDKNTIDYLKKSNELNYSNLKDVYGGYDYKIKSDKTSLNINTTIILDNVDIKQMVKDNLIDSDYVVSNKLTISGAKYFYKEKGANCDI